MTSCKEINKTKEKRTVFDVRIDIGNNIREKIANDLRKIDHGWMFGGELADIIEEG